MRLLLVFCGSPGSGKTTLSRKIAEEQTAIRFSFDEMRCFQHKELLPHVIKALRSGKNVVVDALFTREVWRKTILETTSDIECRKILIYMDTPLEECIRRNAQRPYPLPSEFIENIYKSIEPPTISEGWDEIREVKTYETDFTSN